MTQEPLFSKPPLWVLGAADREMAAIETLLKGAQQEIVYAYDTNGIRVTNFNAYKAELPGVLKRDPETSVITVECNWSHKYRSVKLRRLFAISDRMYGHWIDVISTATLAKEFMAISSLGKVIRYLVERDLGPLWPQHAQTIRKERHTKGDIYYHLDWGWVVQTQTNETFMEIPKELVLVAAGDMCLNLAYRGQACGVDAWELRRFRTKQRAAYKFIHEEVLDQLLNSTINILRERTHGGIADLTDLPEGTLPEAAEAASWLGITVICRMTYNRNGQERLVMFGYGPPKRFIEWMGQQKELGHRVYGDPDKGYVGAYL